MYISKKYFITVLALFILLSSFSQNKTVLKFIPEVSLKIGSQQPKIGIETCLSAGILFNDIYFIGLGGGYTSDLGLGGKTFPLFLDGRIFFSASKVLNGTGFKIEKKLPVQFTFKQGININRNDPYKSGYILCSGLAYRLDIIKINSESILPFYAGFEIEYSRTSFYDEYRNYAVTDGYISQLYLLMKISFDIKAIKL